MVVTYGFQCFLISGLDKKGVIQHIDVHDINKRPPLEGIVRELEKLQK